MGLDNFWEIPEGSEQAEFDPPLKLCGGMFSSHGEGSFRGKVYSTLVETVTGESLYQDEITPSAVREMAASLSRMEFASLPEDFRVGSSDLVVSREEYEDLRRMFASYASLGATLKGWW